MSYKGVNIRREKIDETIKAFSKDIKVEGPIEKANDLYVYKIKGPQIKEAHVNIYYLKDGKTSIGTNCGKNTELSELIADSILEKCEIKDIIARQLYIRKLSNEHYSDLLEYLEITGCKIEGGSVLLHGIQKKITGPYGDHVVINHFNSLSLQVQGNSCVVKAIIIEALTELLPYKEVITQQLEEINIETTADSILKEFNHILPTAFDYLGEKLIVIMSPSVALRHINIELSDYSLFAYPALKGLEGYIKKLLLEKGVEVGKDGFGTLLDYKNNKHYLTEEIKNLVNCNKISAAVEDCYNYYARHRHSLFHVDNNIETTRILEKKEDASDMIEDIYQIIETTYTRIKS